MPTTYPATADTIVSHSGVDFYQGTGHSDQHATIEGAIAALETRVGTTTYGLPRQQEALFTETAGAGVYTASFSLPAGAWIEDIIIHGVAVWTNTGAVTMKVGDVADDDGIFTAIDMKATDLLAAEGLAASAVAAAAGGKAGADLANSQWNRRWLSTARTISGIITAASSGGGAGITRMIVKWTEPGTALAATKV